MRFRKYLVVVCFLSVMLLSFLSMGVASATSTIIHQADVEAVLAAGLANQGALRFPVGSTSLDFQTKEATAVYVDAYSNAYDFNIIVSPDFSVGGITTTAQFVLTSFTASVEGLYELELDFIYEATPLSATINVYDTVLIDQWPQASAHFLYGQKYTDVLLTFEDTFTAVDPEYYVNYAWDYDLDSMPAWGQTSADVNYSKKDANDPYWLVHELTPATGTHSIGIIVDEAALTVALGDSTVTYNGSGHSVSCTSISCDNLITYPTDTSDSDFPGVIEYSVHGEGNYSENLPVETGIYDARFVPADGFSGTASATLTIDPAELTALNFGSESFTYDGTPKGLTTYSIDGIVDSSDASSLVEIAYDTLSGGVPVISPTDAGEYKATLAIKSGVTNYVWSGGAAPSYEVLTIDPAELTAVNFGSESFTYDGTPKGLTTYSIDGIVDSSDASSLVEIAYETLSGGVPVISPTDAGEYKATLAIKSGVTNYVWSGGAAPSYEVLTIDPAELTAVNFGPESFTYDGSPKGLVAYSIDGIVDSSDVSSLVEIAYVTLSGGSPVTSPTNAGEYKATLAIKSGVTNYVWSGGAAPSYKILTIDPAELTAVNFESKGFVFDGSPKSLSYNLGGIVDSSAPSSLVEIVYETVAGGIAVSAPTEFGEYKGTLKIKSGVANYVWSGGVDPHQTLTIGLAELTALNFGPEVFTYDGIAKGLSYSIGGIKDGSAPTSLVEIVYESLADGTLVTSPTKAGQYKGILKIKSGVKNYVWSGSIDPYQILTISPRKIYAVHGNMSGLVYNGEPKPVAWELVNVVSGEMDAMKMTVQYKTDAGYPLAAYVTVPVNAGTYTSTVSFNNSNYQWDTSKPEYVTSLQYSIAPFALSITPNHVDCEWYQAASPVLTYVQGTITGAMQVPVFSGEISCPLFNKAIVGNYPITQGTLALLPGEINDNYTVIFDTTKYVTVKYHTLSGTAAISPAAPDGDNGWYKTRSVISAPAGYSISQAENSGYADTLSFDDGITFLNGFSYYLRQKATGATTAVMSLPGYKQDTTAPALVSYGRSNAAEDHPENFLVSANDNLLLWKIEFYRGSSLLETKELTGTAGEASYTMYAAGTYTAFVYDRAGNIIKTGSLKVEDTDGDGLPDAWEIALGTSIDTADTDGDGLSDGQEKLKYGTNPLVADTDGDKLPDGLEMGAGLNPKKPDSNGDGVNDYVAFTLGFASEDDLNLPLMARMLLGGALGDGRNTGLSSAFADTKAAADALGVLLNSNFLKQPSQGDASAVNLAAIKKIKKQITVVQLDINAKAGVGILGDYLVTFSKNGTRLGIEGGVSLIPMGAVPAGNELVALASDDGSIVLLGHWNAAEKKVEGSLWVSVPKEGKLFELANSQGATAFDIAGDGSSVAYCVNGTIYKLYLTDKASPVVSALGSANTLQYAGNDLMAVGADGSAQRLNDDNTLSAAQVDEYDLKQRTNTSRSQMVVVNGALVQVDVNNAIHVSSNRSSITFQDGDQEETASKVSKWE